MFSRMRPYELFLAADRSQKYARRLSVLYATGRELPVPVPVLRATCVRMRSASWSEIAGTRAGPRLRRWRQR